MTDDRNAIRTRLQLLALAEQLGNVSLACKTMGYSRDSFYRFKRLFERGGEAALADLSRRGRPLVKNRVPPAIEAVVIELALLQPSWGQARVAEELTRNCLAISPFGVRSVWLRHNLETMKKRKQAREARPIGPTATSASSDK